MLSPPSHVLAAGIIGAPLSYQWHGTDDYNRERPALLAQFEAVSVRGVLALATGIAEWTAWRLDGLSGYRAPLGFIEAAWAANIAPQYVIAWDWESEPALQGPVERPLYHLCELLVSVLDFSNPRDATSASQWSIYLAFLARHVLPDAQPFDDWLVAALARMQASHPRDRSDPMGSPVPRSDLELGQPPDSALAAVLLDRFLVPLLRAGNPYLRLPQDMVARGFQGVSYRYP
ncbi:hypothetical protein [Pseudorhodoferax sp. Leaf267]|uniref:hypothetical protein n=1 Tax=Pseudorhodoferax sp. Leaf267 TaxID=1736316 RepID=UPI0006F97205|nr:hypothetical protein [Pseudorhodoferax sp. Leaf267]KQP22421.1 hypothetical protein ASF43_00360 [Pseudorhodoferax sp. Leaf267]